MSTFIVGDNNIETTVDFDGPGDFYLDKFTATATGTLNELDIYLDPADSSSKLLIGIYADSAGAPSGAPLAQGTISTPTPGAWNTVTGLSAAISNGVAYWLCVLFPGTATGTLRRRIVATGGTEIYAGNDPSATTLPNPYSTAGFTGGNAGFTNIMSIRGLGTVSAPGPALTGTGGPTRTTGIGVLFDLSFQMSGIGITKSIGRGTLNVGIPLVGRGVTATRGVGTLTATPPSSHLASSTKTRTAGIGTLKIAIAKRVRILPNAPHFAFPFGRNQDGTLNMCEQDSAKHILSCATLIARTPIGYRDDRPEFGWAWPDMTDMPIDPAPLINALNAFEPRADYTDATVRDLVEETLGTENLTVNVELKGADATGVNADLD